MPKIEIATQGITGHDPRTAHLRLVLEFLLAQGNRPAYSRSEDGWRSDPGGELHYTFTNPLHAAQLHEHFVFPASIQVQQDGSIRDSLNRVDICHERPTRPLSFELVPEHTPLVVAKPRSTDPPVLDNGQADEQLRQLLATSKARREVGPA
jgi:hypothetical protein